MANMANRKMMRLIEEMWTEPERGMIMATRNEDGTFALMDNDIWNFQLIFEPLVCIDPANMYEWDVLIDIRKVILDGILPGFNNGFGFGGDGFPRVRIFRRYERMLDQFGAFQLDENEDNSHRLVRRGLFMEAKEAYLANFNASVRLKNEDTYLWWNTGTDYNNYFRNRDSVIYDRMIYEAPGDILDAGIPYGNEDLHPFGCISARLIFPPELVHNPRGIRFNPPRIEFTSQVFHPSISSDGRVDSLVYPMAADYWRIAQTVTYILDSIITILKAPDDQFIANVDAAMPRQAIQE